MLRPGPTDRCRARRAALRAATATLLALALPLPARAVLAACADGSLVLARRWQDVHCPGAVALEPGEVPPLGPARRAPSLAQRRQMREGEETARERDLERQISAALADAAARAPAPAPTHDGVRGALAPPPGLARRALGARAVALEAADAPPLRLRVGHSPDFEAWLRAARPGLSPGPVLVLLLDGAAGERAAATPSFAQGGVTFRPDPAEPGQGGWLAPAGSQQGGARLGYVALPAHFDPARPMVVFWGDAVAALRLDVASR